MLETAKKEIRNVRKSLEINYDMTGRLVEMLVRLDIVLEKLDDAETLIRLQREEIWHLGKRLAK